MLRLFYESRTKEKRVLSKGGIATANDKRGLTDRKEARIAQAITGGGHADWELDELDEAEAAALEQQALPPERFL